MSHGTFLENVRQSLSNCVIVLHCVLLCIDGCSSLEQGEIVSSSSSPARVAGSSDMDISSGSAGGGE